MRIANAALACALAATAACGGQTGEGDYGANTCVDRGTRSLGDDERAPLGYSPADVLAFANSEQLHLERAGEDAPLTATLNLHPRNARFIRTEPARPVSFPDPCRGRVEQDVEVELNAQLPSGDVQLSATGTLKSTSKYRATLTASFSSEGSDRIFHVDLGPEEKTRTLELRATLTPEGSAGQIEAQIEFWHRVGPQPEPRGDAPRLRDFLDQRRALVANWPATTDCGLTEFPLPLDRTLFEVSPTDVVSAFSQSRALRWSDGGSTRLMLDAHAVGAACLADLNPEWRQSYDYPPIEPEDPVLFGVPIELTIATEDRRFNNQFRAMLQYQPKPAGGLSRAWLVHSAPLAPGDAGGWNVEVANVEQARSTVLQIIHQPDGDLAEAGTVTLYGPARGEPCGTQTLCTNTPPIAAPVLRGTLD